MARFLTFFRIFAVFCLFAGGISAIFAANSFAQDEGQRFAEIKGRFLLTSLNYIELPSGADKYNICIFGDKGVSSASRNFYEASKARLKPASVKAVDEGSDITTCNVVFVGKDYAEKEAVIARVSSEKRPIVSISDIKGFASAKGAVELFDNGGKLAFIINLKKAKQPGMKIDSKLIELAFKTV